MSADTSSSSGQLFNATLAIVGSLSLKDTAKLFTKLAVGSYDAQIVTYYIKYKYKFWRPYTAITYVFPDRSSANLSFIFLLSVKDVWLE